MHFLVFPEKFRSIFDLFAHILAIDLCIFTFFKFNKFHLAAEFTPAPSVEARIRQPAKEPRKALVPPLHPMQKYPYL